MFGSAGVLAVPDFGLLEVLREIRVDRSSGLEIGVLPCRNAGERAADSGTADKALSEAIIICPAAPGLTGDR